MIHQRELLKLGSYIEQSGQNIAKMCNDVVALDESFTHDFIVDTMLDEIHKNNTMVTALLAILAAEQKKEK